MRKGSLLAPRLIASRRNWRFRKRVNFRISRGRRRRQPQKLFRQRAVIVNKFRYDWLAGSTPQTRFPSLIFSPSFRTPPDLRPTAYISPFLFRVRENTRCFPSLRRYRSHFSIYYRLETRYYVLETQNADVALCNVTDSVWPLRKVEFHSETNAVLQYGFYR